MAKKYEAIASFTDSQDKGKVYQKGDPYPNPANKKISVERIKQLLSDNNRLGYAVIKEVKDKE
jgi:hypothetical protein